MPGKAQKIRMTNNHGYIKIYVPYPYHSRADVYGYVCEHILIAERALGKPLPLNAEVHHIDENRSNNQNNNLVICEDHAYHGLLHRRQRILDAKGDPDQHKICSSCKQLRFLHHFNKRSRSPDGLREDCIFCVKQANSKRIR